MNFVRYQFDRGTLLRFLLLLFVLAVGAGRSLFLFRDGWTDSAAFLVLFAFLSAGTAFATRISDSESGVYEILPLPGRTLFLFDMLQRLAFPVAAAVALSLPGFVSAYGRPDRIGGAIGRLGALVALGAGSAALASWIDRRSRRSGRTPFRRTGEQGAPRTRNRWVDTVLPGGGPLAGLVRADVLYLVRRNRWTLFFPLLALLAVLFASLRSGSFHEGWMVVVLLQGVAALLTVNQLLVLFRKDAETIDALRVLPIRGRTLWRARWAEALILTAGPGLAGSAFLFFRFGAGADRAVVPVVAVLTGLAAATLFANVVLGLHVRPQLAGLFLNLAWGLPVLLWFLTPLVSVIAVAFVLGWWTYTAPRAYDRGEADD